MESLSGFDPGWTLPENGTLRTGREYVENYLHPLSRLPALRDRILTDTEVIALGREGLLKKDLPEDDGRSGHPFRILVHEGSGLRAGPSGGHRDRRNGHLRESRLDRERWDTGPG